jgi:hypothetical protein
MYGLLMGTFLAMVSCGGNDSSGHESGPARLLPESPPEWRQVDETKVFAGAALSDYVNGGAEAYLAYRFVEVAARDFQDDSGARLTVEIYEMDSPENAFGIYSTDSSGERWDIGADSAYDSGLLRFWQGQYFLRILCYPPTPSIEAVIRKIGETMSASIDSESRRPELFLSLPPKNDVVSDSVCYFHRQTSLNNIRFLSDENLLRLGDDVDAITWEERAAPAESSDTLRQIALRYQSEEEANAAHQSFTREYLKVEIGAAGPLGAKLENGKFAAIGSDAAWLVVVLDANSAEAATGAMERTIAKIGIEKEPEGSL